MLTKEAIEKIEETLGYTFKSKALLSQAFTRSSYAEEDRMHGGKGLSNEQLEFYGDSVLNYIVVAELAKHQAKADEDGNVISRTEEDMSNFVSFWTDKNMLSFRIGQLQLGKYLLLSKGDRKQNVGKNKSAKEDLYEAIIGAIWFDSNFDIELLTKIVYRTLTLEFSPDYFDKDKINKSRQFYKAHNEEYGDVDPTVVPKIRVDEDGNFVCEIEDEGQSCFIKLEKLSNGQMSSFNVSDEAMNYLDDNEILKLKKKIDPSTVTEANAVQKLLQLFQLKIIKIKPIQEEEFNYENGYWVARITLGDGSKFASTKKTKAEARNECALLAFKYAYDRAGNATKDGKLIEL